VTIASATQDPSAKRDLPFAVLLLVARSARRQFASRVRHRIALVVTLIAVVFEWWTRHRFGDVGGTLNIAAWCAALSVSSTFGASGADSDHEDLARLRGRSSGLRRRTLPMARTALAFTVHGGASILLALGLLLVVNDARQASQTALLLPVLGLTSLLGSVGLALLAELSDALLPKSAGTLFFAVLLVPTILREALPKLPSLMDAWAGLVLSSLQLLPA
jgi:hypothetical protein